MTNFQYYIVPISSNDPGDDAPNMNTDASSTQGILAVDHIGFNTANGGAHIQSQYQTINKASNLVPSNLIGTGFATEYCNYGPGNLQEELYFTRGSSGVAIQLTCGSSGGPAISGVNGWTFLPGNMFMNFGTVTMTGSAGQATGLVNFLNPFGTAVYMINATLIGVNAATTVSSNTTFSVVPVDLTKFTYIFNYSSSGTLTQYPKFYWQAIGR